MTVHSAQLRLSTQGDGEMVDITRGLEEVCATSGVENGIVLAFVSHSTAAITTIEYEPGCIEDFRRTTERLVPRAADYEHNRRAGDSNAHAHLRAALVGPSETMPLRDGRLALGTWQQVVLVDFDDRPRERTVVVQVLS